MGSELGEPSACSQMHVCPINPVQAQGADGCQGEGEREASSGDGGRGRTQGHHSPAGAQQPGRPTKGTGTSNSTPEIRGDARASLEAERPAKGLDDIPDINDNVMQGAISVMMRTRAFHEHYLHPSAGQRA